MNYDKSFIIKVDKFKYIIILFWLCVKVMKSIFKKYTEVTYMWVIILYIKLPLLTVIAGTWVVL